MDVRNAIPAAKAGSQRGRESMKDDESMDYQYRGFIERVEGALQPISPEEAEIAAIATISTLSELISPESARNLGSHLPVGFVDKLDYRTPENPEELADGLSLEDFCERVAEKEGAGIATDEALNHAIGVMKAVKEAYGIGTDPGSSGGAQGIDGTDLERIRDELPEEFAPLLT